MKEILSLKQHKAHCKLKMQLKGLIGYNLFVKFWLEGGTHHSITVAFLA